MSIMDLEIKDLRLIKMIALTGNLTRAAERLNVSQPALSRQLADLEERVGARVFLRQPKGMQATAIGRDLLTLADELLERVDQTEAAIHAQNEKGSGQLTVAIHCMPIFTCLPETLKRFQERYPKVAISATSTMDLDGDLIQEKCDIAITPHCAPAKGIVFDKLFTGEIVIVTSPDNPLAAKEAIELGELAQANYASWVSREHDPVCHLLDAAKVEPLSWTIVNQVSALVDLVSTSSAVAFMPLFAVRQAIASGQLKAIRVKNTPLQLTWFVAHLKERPLPLHAKGLIGIMRAALEGGAERA